MFHFLQKVNFIVEMLVANETYDVEQ